MHTPVAQVCTFISPFCSKDMLMHSTLLMHKGRARIKNPNGSGAANEAIKLPKQLAFGINFMLPIRYSKLLTIAKMNISDTQ